MLLLPSFYAKRGQGDLMLLFLICIVYSNFNHSRKKVFIYIYIHLSLSKTIIHFSFTLCIYVLYCIQVQRYASQLDLILKGDIVGAENLDTSLSKDKENGEGDTQFHTDVTEDLVKHEWTSLQYSLARSVLNKFMKENYKQCERCGAKAAKIKSPTFGWLRKVCFLGTFFFPSKNYVY